MRKRFLPMTSMLNPAVMAGIEMVKYMKATTIAHCVNDILRIEVV